jgi:hypothetical protein
VTDLCTHQTNLTWGRDEPQDFLLKLSSLTQKILFVSQEEGADVQYDEKQLTPMFLHTLCIGLTDETLRREVDPILDSKDDDDDDDDDDDELIQKFGEIVVRE